MVSSALGDALTSIAADAARDVSTVNAFVAAAGDPSRTPDPTLHERSVFAVQQARESIQAIETLGAFRATDLFGFGSLMLVLWVIALGILTTTAWRRDRARQTILPPAPLSVASRAP
jgi:hypothetical protein